jgi:adenylate kinase
MKNIILLGPPGSGKGTQGFEISKILQIPTISTGDALRKEVLDNSEIGKLAKSFMDSGNLVPDEVVLDIVKNRLNQNDCQNGFILDGFPRNEIQALMLENALNSIDKKIDLVLNFEISDEEVVKRISGRIFCKECGAIYNKFFKKPSKEGVCDVCGSINLANRSDDNEGVVRSRLKVYHEATVKLIEYYQKKHLIFSFNAVKSSALLLEELLKVIKNIN